MSSKTVTVETFPSGPLSTNTYLLSTKSGKGAIIDAAPGCTAAVQRAVEAKGVEVEAILLTHSHWDHIAETSEIKRLFPVPVFIHSEDRANLESPGSDGIPSLHRTAIVGVIPDRILNGGERFPVGDLLVEVIHSPGHSPGLVCYYIRSEGILFCGDLFFRGSIGTLALPTSESDRMWPSLKRIATLPAETRVFPGHGKATTIGAEGWLARAKELYGFS